MKSDGRKWKGIIQNEDSLHKNCTWVWVKKSEVKATRIQTNKLKTEEDLMLTFLERFQTRMRNDFKNNFCSSRHKNSFTRNNSALKQPKTQLTNHIESKAL